MKKLIFLLSICALCAFSTRSFGQLLDEKNVTITMDLQPILQLSMEGSDQIDFVFDEIRKYYAGIVKYGATTLRVSSTVNWDLWCVGHSQSGSYWDQIIKYGNGGGVGACDLIPLRALELYQYPQNTRSDGASSFWYDYHNAFPTMLGGAFSTAACGQNSIFAGSSIYVKPGQTDKYIYGHALTGTSACGMGGSYLTQTGLPGTVAGLTSDYFYFVIDYRILPGLPVRFPKAGDNANNFYAIPNGSYAQPGVYQMNVKYLLMEDI
jgi:hypothetical protein